MRFFFDRNMSPFLARAIAALDREHRNKAERAALREAKLTFFCLSKVWTHMQIWEYPWRFIKIWPDIIETASRTSSRPQVFEVSGGKSNKIELISQ
jgi:hypothetical protein